MHLLETVARPDNIRMAWNIDSRSVLDIDSVVDSAAESILYRHVHFWPNVWR